MQVLKTVQEVDQKRIQDGTSKSSLGFVATMGALHQGHLSLVKKAKLENEAVAVSIFVNPIQFNNPSDLKKYPRTLESDLEMLSAVLDQDDYIFVPEVDEMYPDNIKKKYNFGELETLMEGEHRPGHFNGVAIVVDRLFSIIKPSKAYFGEKDFQQIAVIRDLVQQESSGVEIVPCAIMREADGLAMSSRNLRIHSQHRENAAKIYKLLLWARQEVKTRKDLITLQEEITKELDDLPGFKTEYVVFADEASLSPLKESGSKPFRCFIAVFAGEVRLIDNLPMY